MVMTSSGSGLLLAVLLATSGCRRQVVDAPAPPPAIDITAGYPRRSGTYPTELRILQLRSVGLLERATYDQLRDDAGALGPSVVARVETPRALYPGETWQLTVELDPDARFLVVLAFLHRPIGRSWQAVIALPPPGARAGRYRVDLEATRVVLRRDTAGVEPPRPSQRQRPRRPTLELPADPLPESLPSPSIPSTPSIPATPMPPATPAWRIR